MGPTASGKSAVAMNLAQRMNGVIINADAMQMYRDLRILTARPTEEEEERIPHRLYGVLDATKDSSVALWLRFAVPIIRVAMEERKRPIVVGGTGMYIKALMEGIAEIPEIPTAVRQQAQLLGKDALEQYDPIMNMRLAPGDTQRRLRALEVVLATGVSLATWQERKVEPPMPEAFFRCYHMEPPRDELYDRINRRFEQMLANGALDEVAALKAKILQDVEKNPSQLALYRPILKAHGVPELLAHLAGEIPLEVAMAKAQQNTCNYAKRQLTWLRHQGPKSTAISSADDILDRHAQKV